MKNILIIDNDDAFVDTTKFYLEHKEYNVIVAKTAKEAKEKLKEDIDIVLLESVLPDADGLRFCKKIKKINSALPVLIISSKFKREDVSKAIQNGANGYLYKPISLSRLLSRIEELIKWG